MKKTIWMLLPVLALAACEKEDNAGTMPADGKIEIVTGVEALTRAPQLDDTGAGNFRTGDTFTLTVSSNGKSVQKDYTVGSTTLYWQDLGVEGDKVAFAGCYPNHEGADAAAFEFDARRAWMRPTAGPGCRSAERCEKRCDAFPPCHAQAGRAVRCRRCLCDRGVERHFDDAPRPCGLHGGFNERLRCGKLCENACGTMRLKTERTFHGSSCPKQGRREADGDARRSEP